MVKTLSITVNNPTKKRIDEICEKKGISTYRFLKEAILNHIKNNSKN